MPNNTTYYVLSAGEQRKIELGLCPQRALNNEQREDGQHRHALDDGEMPGGASAGEYCSFRVCGGQGGVRSKEGKDTGYVGSNALRCFKGLGD